LEVEEEEETGGGLGLYVVGATAEFKTCCGLLRRTDAAGEEAALPADLEKAIRPFLVSTRSHAKCKAYGGAEN